MSGFGASVTEIALCLVWPVAAVLCKCAEWCVWFAYYFTWLCPMFYA